MALEGDWLTQQIISNGANINDFAVFKFPTGTDRLYGFSEGFYITTASKHADLAAKFLDYMTSDAVQADIGPNFAATSVNQHVKYTAKSNPVQDAMATLIGNTTSYYLNNDQNLPLDVTTEYWRIQNAVLTGDVPPADAGNQLQQFIEPRLKEER